MMLTAATGKKYATYYPLFLCASRAGLRQGEPIALKGTDIDVNGRFIHVRRNLSLGSISATKSGKDRKVDMSSQLTAVLNELNGPDHKRARSPFCCTQTHAK